MENENKAEQDVMTTVKNKKNSRKRQQRKLAWLFTITGITAMVLIVETYAWFIGTGSVQTSEFEIGVSTEKSLFLSLDGIHWAESLTISEASVTGTLEEESLDLENEPGTHNAYEGNTNKWVGSAGLIPISTNGEKDYEVSRLKLYGKSSITATPGGFRLISTRLDNYNEVTGEDGEGTGKIVDEKDGYVVFDLFIKNGEGTDYIEQYNYDDDEAIYLTTDSSVSVVKAGAETEEDYGLANSVRIAFAQIGRVASAGITQDKATSIVCKPTNTGKDAEENTIPVKGEQTGLCEETATTIWEPNDTSHNANLIEYFTRVCKGKKVTKGEDDSILIEYGDSEDAKCITLTDGEAVNTYVVNQDIKSTDHIDIYDGLNGYDIENETDYKISKHETFTDTDKNEKNEKRPEFFRLAANSVTKIRVYIYLEGQDVDNYDLVSLGNKIKINFGFTKDQFDLQNNKDNQEELEEGQG